MASTTTPCHCPTCAATVPGLPCFGCGHIHTTPETPLEQYTAMVRAIGPGFHPDTPGDGYTSLPDTHPAPVVDAILAMAEIAGIDTYAVALDVLA